MRDSAGCEAEIRSLNKLKVDRVFIPCRVFLIYRGMLRG